jgi:hypothetical protein
MFRSRGALAVLFVVAVLAISTGAWLATSDTPADETSLAVETPIATAQPSGTPSLHPAVPPVPTSSSNAPRPDATALAQLTQIIEHYGGKTPGPIFVGEMNGFTFVSVRPANFGLCATGELPQIVATNPDSQLVRDSGLGFDVTYVPGGYELEDLLDGGHDTGPVLAGGCDGTVISLTETWHSRSGDQFTVSRRSMPPVIVSYISKDRLMATMLGGKPAIVVEPRYDGERIDISLRDDHSLWGIGSEDLSMDELKQVASGIQ